ncbi:hypothetical protein [Kutzneria buriramensis]|uniref:Uncharacterized protein n=1 Tax=Kutzneria buriramensis TaxID=1045776 RepID=A0A3E0HPJ2_9PSEU|nr:hypothetical protein [Kutzneria buriramensis]REH48176.1 hypothetical protein BCF44_10534 [Kutzneria buriramensis]
MAPSSEYAPPRPIAPGDVVAAFSPHLGEWTAAQITRLDPGWRTADVLDLDWSGPEPHSVDDLGDVEPLAQAHRSYEWVLPRSRKIIGNLPVLRDEPSWTRSHGWDIGTALATRRRRERGDNGPFEPWRVRYSADEFAALPDTVRTDVTVLEITDIVSLDCGRVVQLFPRLDELMLTGDLGDLTSAHRLNELRSLRRIYVSDLFGMSKEDRLLPRHVPELEILCLDGIPTEYAAAMRAAWRPEIPHGVLVDITRGRKPEWVAENRDNPLRDWDGREHISDARYKKSVALYKATRRAVLDALAGAADRDRLEHLGREYGEAFNQLDGRVPFIETEEREELFDALAHIVGDAEDLVWARDALFEGVEAVRNW